MVEPRPHGAEAKEALTKEIERKYVVNSSELPHDIADRMSRGGYKRTAIDQAYVMVGEVEVRVRSKVENPYTPNTKPAETFLTVKAGSGMTRIEQEKQIGFNTWLFLTEESLGRVISKIRHEIPYREHLIELDVYGDELTGLITAEVEFASETDAQGFIPPVWFGPEVTDDGRYKNQQLAINGLPVES